MGDEGLLHCPFCGSHSVEMKRPDAVWCGGCLAEMPEHDPGVPGAAKRWNTRSPDFQAAIDKTAARMEAAFKDRPKMKASRRADDPMERLIADALDDVGIAYVHECSHHLDFYLPDSGLHIEVKRMHSDRIAEQMSRVPNVIVAQGKEAVEALAAMIRGKGL